VFERLGLMLLGVNSSSKVHVVLPRAEAVDMPQPSASAKEVLRAMLEEATKRKNLL